MKQVNKSSRILLVDDDQDYLFQKQVELEKEGFAVTTAAGHQEGLKCFSENEFDLAIIDLMMEEQDAGFVLAWQIKRQKPTFPVIMVTGVTAQTGLQFNAITENERSWFKADMVLTKPVRGEQLVREIRRLLENGNKI